MRASWSIRTPLGDYRLRVARGFALAQGIPSEDLWFFASREIEELRPEAVGGAMELHRALTGKPTHLTGTPEDTWVLAILTHDLESALRNGRIAFEQVEPPLVRARAFRPAELPEAQGLVDEFEEVSMSIASNFDDEWPELELEDEYDEWPDLDLSAEADESDAADDLSADADDSEGELIENAQGAESPEDNREESETARSATIGDGDGDEMPA
jgi:hypothetical protein